MGVLKRGFLVECDECGEEYIMADTEDMPCQELCPEDVGCVCMSCYLSLLAMEAKERYLDYEWHLYKADVAYHEWHELEDILHQFI